MNIKKQSFFRLKKITGILLMGFFFCVGGLGNGVVFAQTCPAGYDPVKGVCIPNTTGLSTTPVATILMSVMNWLLAVLGFIAVIGFAISGIQYLTAAGDEKMIGTAKTNMKYSIIGVVVALSGFVLITAIDSLLNGSSAF